MTRKFLDQVYAVQGADSTRKLYDDWAASYEAEVADNGYATPGRCAAALARHMPDLSVPILDFGCGTGLSGLALRAVGFSTIDGLDLSADMLAVARDKGIYRSLAQIEADAELGHAPGTYAAIAAIGVIGAGAAPIAVFDTILDGLTSGGLIVLSFNDHALEDPAYEGKLHQHADAGTARILSQDYGPHLPGLNLNSRVYVVEKT